MRDFRWLSLLVSAIVVVALLVLVRQKITPEQSVRLVYDTIEALPEGSTVFLAMDFDPQAKAELEPMSLALLRHCMRKKLKVIGMTFWWAGNAFSNGLFLQAGSEFPELEWGRDYVYLGYQPGGMAQVITGLVESIPRTFPQDYSNRATSSMPIFRQVGSLKEVDYLVDIAAGATPRWWILYAGDKYKVKMAVGCTAVSGPDMFVRLNAGQINGLIAGMRGAADYETLLEWPGLGTRGMFAQSLIHVVIVALVIGGNVFYLRARWLRKREA